jgi:seryl-tRNA synthetase
MHDLNHFRENLALYEKMAAQRHVSIDFDAFRSLDRQRRETITAGERLKADRNKASEEIARRKRAGQDAGDLLAQMKSVSDEIKRADERIAAFDARLQDFMLSVPNLPHSSVPVGADASANVEVRRWGAPPKFDFAPRPHWEVGERTGIPTCGFLPRLRCSSPTCSATKRWTPTSCRSKSAPGRPAFAPKPAPPEETPAASCASISFKK